MRKTITVAQDHHSLLPSNESNIKKLQRNTKTQISHTRAKKNKYKITISGGTLGEIRKAEKEFHKEQTEQVILSKNICLISVIVKV